MDKLGVFFTCFDEVDAVSYAIQQLYGVYPNISVYLVTESCVDYSFLTDKYKTISVNVEKDTMSETFNITDKNFKESKHQENIKICVLELINRLNKCIEFCKTDYILMMDPDTLVRGELNIPLNATLLGSRINVGLPTELRRVISTVKGSVDINCWGATPAIFKVNSYKRAVDKFFEYDHLLDNMCMSFYAMYAHDVLLPVLFSLIGEYETFNPDIVECLRNPYWERTKCPIVHQFRKFYK